MAKECHHRVGRVLSFFSSRRNWDFPNPSPPPPPSLVPREGMGESQFRRGEPILRGTQNYCNCLPCFPQKVNRSQERQRQITQKCTAVRIAVRYILKSSRIFRVQLVIFLFCLVKLFLELLPANYDLLALDTFNNVTYAAIIYSVKRKVAWDGFLFILFYEE